MSLSLWQVEVKASLELLMQPKRVSGTELGWVGVLSRAMPERPPLASSSSSFIIRRAVGFHLLHIGGIVTFFKKGTLPSPSKEYDHSMAQKNIIYERHCFELKMDSDQEGGMSSLGFFIFNILPFSPVAVILGEASCILNNRLQRPRLVRPGFRVQGSHVPRAKTMPKCP